MRRFLTFLVLFLSSSALQAHEIDAGGRCIPRFPEIDCRRSTFVTTKGATVEVRSTYSESPGNRHFSGVTITYTDAQNYFEDADTLYPFVEIYKHRLKLDGSIENTKEAHVVRLMEGGANEYVASLYIDIEPQSDSSFGEVIDMVSLAFTDVLPHAGTNRWDSNDRKNYNVWVGLSRGMQLFQRP